MEAGTWHRLNEVPAKQKKTDPLPEYKSLHVATLGLQTLSYMLHFALFAVRIRGVVIALLWMQQLRV